MKDLLQRAEALLMWLVYTGFRLLPLDVASAAGGRLARALGPLLPLSRRALRNLELTLPEQDHRPIIADMWENLGRIAGEYPHSARFATDPARMEIVGGEAIAALRDAGQPMLFFSGHIGNWELSYALMARLGLRGAGVYRALDNPRLNWLLDRRKIFPQIDMIAKGAPGARKIIEVLTTGKSLAMLVDQKMNDGIAAPFFGRPSMTAPALAGLALKFDCPVVPFRILRIKGTHFRAEFLPPQHFAKSNDRNADLLAAMTWVNGILESWIREEPAQWLWLHRRWDKAFYLSAS